MERKAYQAAFAALGAIVGAGFASGREVASFFSRYGAWSWLGIAAAAVTAWLLCAGVLKNPGIGGMPEQWKGRLPGRVWQGMFGLLTLTTGGAMLAGGGEIAALMFPVHGAYGIGLAVTAICTLLLAWKGMEGSAAISRVMVLLLMLMAAAGFGVTREIGGVIPYGGPAKSVLSGACYAGFNMALAVPGLAVASGEISLRGRRQCALMTAGMLAALLIGGNALMLHHPRMQGEAMPFVKLMAEWGRAGYVLAGMSMYMAILTTACASLRGLWLLLPDNRWWRMAALTGMLACTGLGFTGLVEKVYPMLGAACLGLMAASMLAQMRK